MATPPPEPDKVIAQIIRENPGETPSALARFILAALRGVGLEVTARTIAPTSGKVVGIYAITHIATGRIYLGQSRNVKVRWNQHLTLLNQNRHSNHELQADWNEHGGRAFEMSLIECVENPTRLSLIEAKWIARLKPYYNRQMPMRVTRKTPLKKGTKVYNEMSQAVKNAIARNTRSIRHDDGRERVVGSVSAVAKELGLCKSSLARLLQGKIKSMKGWTLNTPEIAAVRARRRAYKAKLEWRKPESITDRAPSSKPRPQYIGHPHPHIMEMIEMFGPLLLELRNEGLTQKQIAEEMNRRGLRTVFGGVWHPSTVGRTLQRLMAHTRSGCAENPRLSIT